VPAVESLGSGAVVVVDDVSVDVVAEVSGAGSSAKATVALANERPAQAISERTTLRSMFPSIRKTRAAWYWEALHRPGLGGSVSWLQDGSPEELMASDCGKIGAV
jgi:hypothetical protein